MGGMVGVTRPVTRVTITKGNRVPMVSNVGSRKVEVRTTRTVVNGSGGLTAGSNTDGIVIVGNEIRVDIASLPSG